MGTGSLSALASGFALGGGLIVAIGAQNAFVLKHGLRCSHVAAVAATCALVDIVLISLGALGFGTIVSRFPVVTSVAAWAGAAFLVFYGAKSFWSAARPGTLGADGAPAEPGGDALVPVLGATLAVSLLNPHVYLDTIVLIGSIAAQYPPAPRAFFALGAASASVIWFFGLAFGARALAPVFARPVAWRVLDVLIGVVMWWIAAGLVLGQVH